MKSLLLILLIVHSIFSIPWFEFRPGLTRNFMETDSFPCAKEFIDDGVELFDGSRAFKMTEYSSIIKFSVDTIFRKNCFRFDFAIDSINVVKRKEWAQNKSDTTPSIRFLSVITDDRNKKPYIESIFSLFAVKRDAGWVLEATLYDQNTVKAVFSEQLEPLICKKLYTAQIIISVDTGNTISNIEFNLNGNAYIRQIKLPENKISKTIEFWFGNSELDYYYNGSLYLDNIAFSNEWLDSPPRKPAIEDSHQARNTSARDKIVLVSPQMKTFPKTTRRLFSQYQINYSDNSWELPLFDSDREERFKDTLDIDFALDYSRNYSWRVRHFTADSSFSDWSTPVPLVLAVDSFYSPDTTTPEIIAASFHEIDNSLPVQIIEKEKWYNLQIKATSPGGFDKLGYAIMWACDANYVSGNVFNRGGIFLPASNYVYNFSIDPLNVYEKNEKGAYRTTRLSGRIGLYIDGRDSSYRINPKDSTITLRVKFLSEAQTGQWCLRGFIRAIGEKTSPLHYSLFTLIEAETYSRPLYIYIAVALLIIAIIASIVFFFLKKSGVTTGELPLTKNRELELFNKLSAYLKDNLHREIPMSDIETYMSMSYSSIHRLMKAMNIDGAKNYILELKIGKAKELLVNTDKSITEIMGDVGFNNTPHFSKIFKKFTSKSPRQYREENVSRRTMQNQHS